MAWFRFTGKNSLGNAVQGQHKANSELELTAHLKSLGIVVVSIQSISHLKVFWLLCMGLIYSVIPIRKINLSVFYYQLAGMLSMGMSIKNSLLVIISHLSNPRFIKILEDVLDKLSKGYDFHHAMKSHKSIFSDVMVNLISLAHSRNELVAVLHYCDQAMQRFVFIRKLLYIITPQLALMAIFIAILIFARYNYLADFRFAIYVFSNPEPVTIKIFAFLTGLITVHLVGFCVGVILFFIIMNFLLKKITFLRYCYDGFLLCIPVVRGVLLAKERERLALIYSVLLEGGATIQKCAKYSAAVVVNTYFKRKVIKMAVAVNQGDSFSEVLKRFNIFSSAEVQLIALGVVSCTLPKTFNRVYSVSQMVLEKKFAVLTESTRILMYALNVTLLLFTAVVLQQLFFYPGIR